MKILHIDRVRARLNNSDDFERFRKKAFSFRKLIAGDMSPLQMSPVADKDGPDNEIKSLTEIYDFIVTSYEEGRSNKLLQQTKTLLQQTAYMFPEIEFEDLTPEEAVLNNQYCKIRLGEAPRGCNAKDHLRLSLLDYMISGVGWAKACLRNEKPVLMHCDSLDMSWDRSVRLPCDARWASCRFREPLYVWTEMFGKGAFKKEFAGNGSEDDIIELEWYYDVDGGPQGSMYVFRSDGGGGILGDPVYKGSNPYYFIDSGRKIPFIPYEPIYYMALPSLRVPIGIVEMMLPNQIAVWESENNIRTTIKRGAPAYVAGSGAINEEAMQQLQDGEIGAVIELAGNDPNALSRLPALDVSQTNVNWHQYNESEITGHSGANPYAVGQRVEGVQFASEVNAIQGNAGLVAGTIGKDVASYWERCTRKFLGVASLYDDLDISVRIDENILSFDAADPIKQYLRPDAEITVSENTIQFRPKSDKIAEALADLQISMQLAERFPGALIKSYTNYLRAKGEKNIDSWLEPPQPQPIEPATLVSPPTE